jgi:hypothetical protein
MSTLAATHPTLLDLKMRLDPNGTVGTIIEVLHQTNEVIEDMVWIEGNLPTGNQSIVRTGLPAPTWRKLYGGVQPTKSTTAKVTDACGMLEAYAEVDAKLVDIANNAAAFRMTEDMAHLEGMNQEFASTLWYGNEGTEPEAFTGFAPRFNDQSAANGDNILTDAATPDSTDNTSMWLIGWGPTTVHGIYPKGTMAGFKSEDKGRVTIESIDGAGGRMEAYRSHYQWDCGLAVRDWRYVVRINFDLENVVKDAATGPDLFDLMVQAVELFPSLGNVRPAFYCNRITRTWLRRQLINKVKNSTLSMEQIAGKQVLAFDGIPVRRSDAILNTEAGI